MIDCVLGAEPLSARLAALLAQHGVTARPDAGQSLSSKVLRASGDQLALRASPKAPEVWISRADIDRRSRGASDLAKACAAQTKPSVLDAMAGLGVDSAVLAARGCLVESVERHPAIALLLADLADRSAPPFHSRRADAWDVLALGSWDVVYLDPMFPARGKSALPGKRLQAIAGLVQSDPRPIDDWLHRATQAARRRVVLKRRLKDPVTGKPSGSIRGRSVRFDLYAGECRGEVARCALTCMPASAEARSTRALKPVG